jgi:hypothetical protein
LRERTMSTDACFATGRNRYGQHWSRYFSSYL